jgi:hypothetical protein
LVKFTPFHAAEPIRAQLENLPAEVIELIKEHTRKGCEFNPKKGVNLKFSYYYYYYYYVCIKLVIKPINKRRWCLWEEDLVSRLPCLLDLVGEYCQNPALTPP